MIILNTFENVHLKCNPWAPVFRFQNTTLISGFIPAAVISKGDHC